MDLEVFHDTVRYFLNKEQGGWLSPEEIDNIADRAQMWYFVQCLPSYGKTQKSTDPLLPFAVKESFTTGSDGILELPVDINSPYQYETLPTPYVAYSDGTRTRYKPIKLLSEDEIAERLDSQILAPTITDPVGQELAPIITTVSGVDVRFGQIQLYPEAVISGTVNYLRRPVKPVFDYTQSGRTISYRQGYSTQLEWSETAINKILVKTLQMSGINLSDEMIIQIMELKNSQDV